MANQPTKTKAEWINSIETLLSNVDYGYIQSSSISVVPESLKKFKEDAYMPRVVSIGPRFKESRDDLLLMEEVKLRCMMSLIHRGADAGESLEKCSKAVWELDEEVRTSYVTQVKLQQHELSTIMLLDGCFLLELLISKGLNSELPSRYPGPAAEVLKNQDVLSDLMLLENQIPIMVLHKLSQTLFPNVFEPDRIETEEEEEERIEREEQRKRERAEKINNLVLTVLGYSPLPLPYLEAPHILDLVHFSVNTGTSESTNISSQDEDVVVDIDTHTTETQQQQLKLKRCALRLLTSGVTLKAKLHEDNKDSSVFGCLYCFGLVWKSLRGTLFWLCNIFLVHGKHFDEDHIPEEGELKGLDFNFKFEKGKLEIEQLHIKKTTKAMWCNLIAWEHHKKHIHVSDVSGGKFTLAALIFNCLICSPDDVQLLKDKKIVVDHLKMSNEDLMKFFHTIAFGVDYNVVDFSSYSKMVDDINNYTKEFFIKGMWKTVWTSFIYRKEWFLSFIYHNYNFVATVISILTAVQTVYTMLGYYSPK